MQSQTDTPSVRVLVLDGRIQSCLPVLRALYAGGHHVTIAESDPLCVGFASRYAHQRLRHRDPRQDPEGFLEDVRRFVAGGDFDVLIPILDVTAELISRHKAELSRFVRIPLVDYPIFMKARDKSQTMRIAQDLGLPCPRTYFPGELGIDEIAGAVAYPVLIKPNFSIGARGITKIDRPEDLRVCYPLISKQFGPCSIQEYISQTDFQYKAQLFLDRQGEVKTCIICKKLRYYPLSGGSGTLFCTIKNQEIARLAEKLLRALGWYGYGDIDFIADPQDGIVKIMEINPRLSAPVKICFEAGVDLADMLVRFALDYDVPVVEDYEEGVYLRHEGLDFMWFLASPDRFGASPSWFWLWSRKLKYQISSFSDPLPICAYLLSNLRDLFYKESREYKFTRQRL